MTSGEELEQGGSAGAGKDIPPWLQPVPEDEEDSAHVTGNKMLIATIAGAVVILALFVSVILYLYDDTSNTAPIHVEAPKDAVKEKPADPGGMQVAHQDKSIFDQSGGVQPRPQVELGAQPEVPVAEIPEDPVGDVIEKATEASAGPDQSVQEPQASEVEETTSSPTTAPAASETVAPATAPKEAVPSTEDTGPQYRVQLGAYGSENAAARAWRTVRGRFPSRFDDKAASYESVQAGDRTLYRLRVGPYADRASADQVCLALRANEQACIVVNP